MHEIGLSNYIRSLQNLDPGFQIIIIFNNHYTSFRRRFINIQIKILDPKLT